MSYTALYRKFRPQTFDEVKGQDHIVTTLQNQINAGRIGHAYLFCGTRGTGKTSIAKIFAKAVNCEHPINGSPCNECATCKAIAAGSSMNSIEIDAASNNGVENVRQIREEIEYSPTEGKYKVYIIDEVHMLSNQAFNALLKTLEEPPSYVIFVLATTEAHKIPITILSRCQRYDFKRITIDTIADRLKEIMDNEQIEYEDKAIRYVAKAGDGSMRDALSLLDQCIAFYLGKKITYDNVLEVLGAVDTEVFSRLIRSIIKCDVVEGMRVIDDMVVQGRELDQFVSDFTWYLRNLLLVKTADNIEDLIDASTERVEALKQEAGHIEAEVIMRYIRIFSKLSSDLKNSTQKRVLIEIALIKINKPMMETDMDSMINRIALLEKRLEDGVVMSGQIPQNANGFGTQNSGQQGSADQTAGANQNSAQNTQTAPPPMAVPEDIRYVADHWGDVIKLVSSPIVRAKLGEVRLSVKGDNTLIMAFEHTSMGFDVCNKPEIIEMIETIIANEFGRQVKVEVKQLEGGNYGSDYYFQEIQKKINNITIQEEDF
jgi:DNA polymerase-3 subunit gamma/tau